MGRWVPLPGNPFPLRASFNCVSALEEFFERFCFMVLDGLSSLVGGIVERKDGIKEHLLGASHSQRMSTGHVGFDLLSLGPWLLWCWFLSFTHVC